MLPIHQQQSEDFAKYTGEGDHEHLKAMAEREKPYLFEYLLRMTGQVGLALDSFEEAFAAVTSADKSYSSYEEFRTKLYLTSRSFSAAAWNSDTKELEHNALGRARSLLEHDSKKSLPFTDDLLSTLDQQLKELSGAAREPIILHGILSFGVDELSRMFQVDANLVQERLDLYQRKICEKTGIESDKFWPALSSMPLHKIPGTTRDATQALSQMIEGVDEAKKTFLSPRKILLVTFIIAAMIALLYTQGLFS